MSPNREITIHLMKFEQEQFYIENRRYEIRREIDELEREDDYLANRFNELESILTSVNVHWQEMEEIYNWRPTKKSQFI